MNAISSQTPNDNEWYPNLVMSIEILLLSSIRHNCIQTCSSNQVRSLPGWVQVPKELHILVQSGCPLETKWKLHWTNVLKIQQRSTGQVICFPEVCEKRTRCNRTPESKGAVQTTSHRLHKLVSDTECHTQLFYYTDKEGNCMHNGDKCWHLSRYKCTDHILPIQSVCVLSPCSLCNLSLIWSFLSATSRLLEGPLQPWRQDLQPTAEISTEQQVKEKSWSFVRKGDVVLQLQEELWVQEHLLLQSATQCL